VLKSAANSSFSRQNFMSGLICYFLFALAIWLAWGRHAGNDSKKIAEVAGTTITQTELDRSAGKALSSAREQLISSNDRSATSTLGLLLTGEANNRNVSVSTLLE
jgi:predicted negative regulator of RcsB-dependent stress response